MSSSAPVAHCRLALAVLVLTVAAAVGGLGCANRAVPSPTPAMIADPVRGWDDTGSREVSPALVQDLLDAPWANQWLQRSGRKPTVIVRVIRNMTTEHVPVGILVGDIERALVNSGQMSVVATAAERQELRSERADQWQNATEETAREIGRELGADFMLSGAIESVTEQQDGENAFCYLVDLTLLNLESNEKPWAGQRQIKKVGPAGRPNP